jgi:hypothetical protein
MADPYIVIDYKALAKHLGDELAKYQKAMDAIYNHSDEARAAVIQHFGIHHTRIPDNTGGCAFCSAPLPGGYARTCCAGGIEVDARQMIPQRPDNGSESL